MTINYIAIAIATVVQFIIGAIWYSFLFGKLWAKIHGFDKIPKEEQEKMMKKMGPLYGLQLLVTIITTFVLAIFITYQPDWNAYAMTGFLWIGFIVPTQVSGVIFGGTEGKWISAKILIMAGASLACLMSAALIIKLI